MTRDEAIDIYKAAGRRVEAGMREEAWYSPEFIDRIVRDSAEDAIDGLVALGLIKLDEEDL